MPRIVEMSVVRTVWQAQLDRVCGLDNLWNTQKVNGTDLTSPIHEHYHFYGKWPVLFVS